MNDNQVTYSVLVGNLGWVVQECQDKKQAEDTYDEYVHMSKTGEGSIMAYQEQVSLWASDDPDPLETYEPETDNNQTIYRVLVGDLSWVAQECTDYDTAKRDYDFRIEESKHNIHVRWYQEQVTLWSSENEDDPIEWYEPEIDDDDDDDDESAMHECKFCHCLELVDGGGHSCQEFTDAGNAPVGTPERELWESVMNGTDSGFMNLDGSEEE